MPLPRCPPVAIAIAAFALIGAGGPGRAALDGDVRGLAVLAPACPGPARVGKPCAPKPIATMIDVFRAPNDPAIPGKPYRRIRSDMHGRFRISLAPDTYWFVPHIPQPYSKIPSAKPREITVTAGTVTITLIVDTGMR